MHNQIKILSTKILNTDVIEQAASDNISIECIPFIETKYIADVDLQQQINWSGTPTKHVIFTSANAVKAVTQNLEDRPAWDIFCISGSTKKAVQQFFPGSEILEYAPYGDILANKILQRKEVSEVLFFCGSRRLDTIPKTLSNAGVVVRELVVYETILTPVKIDSAYDGVLFFSPSAVESFFQLNRLNSDTSVFAIGETTADALRKHCIDVRVSAETTQQGVLKVVKESFLQQGNYDEKR
jgi:uroporphyrinogen-III synthase